MKKLIKIKIILPDDLSSCNSYWSTPVVFRYDLTIIGVAGDTILLPDIYKRGPKKEPLTAVIRVDP